MASLVSDIITRFRVRYGDCSAPQALIHFNDALREITSRAQIRRTSITTALVAGTREYDLDVSVFKVYEAYYETSSAERFPLIMTSLDELDVREFGWQAQNFQSTPMRMYVSSTPNVNTGKQVIGLDPIPAVTTDIGSGYPRVSIYENSVVDLLTTDTVPSMFISDRVFILTMFRNYATDARQEDLPLWTKVAEDEINRNVAHIRDMQATTNQEIVLAPFQQSRVI
jgi:hypothetical protein